MAAIIFVLFFIISSFITAESQEIPGKRPKRNIIVNKIDKFKQPISQICHLFLYYNLFSTGPCEINKITLEIWGNNYCGSNHGPYIEIRSANGEKRNTYFHGPFSSGTTLIWDNNGENRYGGKNLGGVSGFQVNPYAKRRYSLRLRADTTEFFIWFRIVGGGGDDFCPKNLMIYCNDGTIYKKYVMRDWVDNKKGGGWRLARSWSHRIIHH